MRASSEACVRLPHGNNKVDATAALLQAAFPLTRFTPPTEVGGGRTWHNGTNRSLRSHDSRSRRSKQSSGAYKNTKLFELLNCRIAPQINIAMLSMKKKRVRGNLLSALSLNWFLKFAAKQQVSKSKKLKIGILFYFKKRLFEQLVGCGAGGRPSRSRSRFWCIESKKNMSSKKNLWNL